ncbi:MAG: hypothetical protein WEB09_06850 [Nitriliruptor sp.]
MILCWDASAIVKLVVEEPGSDLAARLWAEDAPGLATWDRQLHGIAAAHGVGVAPADIP